MKEKLITEISIMHNSTIYIHFMMGMGGPVRYYLLVISNKSSIEN